MKTIDKRWLSLGILLAAPLLSVIDMFIINVAIPSIKKGLGATDAEIQLTIAGYLLGYAIFLITGGRAGDFFGRKKTFVSGMLAFTILSCLCGLSQTGLQLNIARFFQGVSAAVMVPQTITYIQVLFPKPEERTKAIGLFGITLGLAAIVGQFAGGYFAEIDSWIQGWRLIFFINLPIGSIALLMAHKYLKETTVDKALHFDYSGVAILTITLLLLIFPLAQGRDLGWPLWSILAIASFLPALLFFIWHQKNRIKSGKQPLINLELFNSRDFNFGLFIVLLFFMMHASYLLTCTIYFQTTLNIPPFRAGLAFVFMGIGFVITSLLSVKYVIRYGNSVVICGVAIMMIAQSTQLFFFGAKTSWWQIAVTLFIYGFGNGIVMPSLMNMALKNIPVKFAGAAAGVYSTFQQTASALGVSVIGGLFFTIAQNQNAKYAGFHYTAFHYCLVIQLSFVLVCGILISILPSSKKNTAGQTAPVFTE